MAARRHLLEVLLQQSWLPWLVLVVVVGLAGLLFFLWPSTLALAYLLLSLLAGGLLASLAAAWQRVARQAVNPSPAPSNLAVAPATESQAALPARFEEFSRLTQKFFIADQEDELILALLRAVMSSSDACGASFVPLDEFSQPQAMLSLGELPQPAAGPWLEYLASPAVRIRCQGCEQQGRLVNECPLLQGAFAEAGGVFCLPVKRLDRELGVLNLFFPAGMAIPAGLDQDLRLLLETGALAVESLRLRRRELEEARQVQAARSRADLSSLGLARLEYQAVTQERMRLAREIHDGLAQTLGFLKLQAAQMQSYQARGDQDRLAQALERSYVTLAEAYQDARQAIDGLRQLPEAGSPAAWLAPLAAEFEDLSGLTVTLEISDPQPDLPPEVNIQLVRIVQEALSNVRKHAHGSQVWISCQPHADELWLEVRDNGCGFSPDEVASVIQHGVQGMRERAELIGADFQIGSQPSGGARVQVRLPLVARHPDGGGK